MMSLFLWLYLKGKKNVRVFFIIFFKSIHKNYLLKNNSQLFLRTKLWLFGNTKLFILLVVSYNTLKTKKQKKKLKFILKLKDKLVFITSKIN